MVKTIEKKTFISILIAVRNGEKTIEKCIESILKQNYTSFEIVIVDDGSTDSTKDIIKRINSKKIKIYTNNGVKGQAGALNYGMKKCMGKYIFRIDADDEMLQHRIAIQIKEMDENPKITMSVGGRLVCYENRVRLIEVKKLNYIKVSDLLFGNPIPHSTATFRRESLEKNKLEYDTKYESAEDFDLWFKIAKLGIIKYVDQPLIKYHESLSQVSNTSRVRQATAAIRIKLKNIFDLENQVKTNVRTKAFIIVTFEVLALFYHYLKMNLSFIHER